MEAIRIDPHFADAYFNLANTFRDAGKMESAIQLYSAAAVLKPRCAHIFSHLAYAYKDSGKILEAIDSYERAIKIKPWFPDAFCNLVHTYQVGLPRPDKKNFVQNLRAYFGHPPFI